MANSIFYAKKNHIIIKKALEKALEHWLIYKNTIKLSQYLDYGR